MTESIQIAIVHADRLHREALAAALGTCDGLSVSGAYPHADDVPPARPQPQVLILDLGLPERTGLVDARLLKATHPGGRLLMTGCPDREDAILACVEAGVSGYHPIDGSLEELCANVRAVAAGRTVCSPRVVAMLFDRVAEYATQRRRLEESDRPRLTQRELEVLHEVGKQLSNKEIASELNIEVQTVKNHVHSILDKLQVRRRQQAVRHARRRGLLSAPRGREVALSRRRS